MHAVEWMVTYSLGLGLVTVSFFFSFVNVNDHGMRFLKKFITYDGSLIRVHTTC